MISAAEKFYELVMRMRQAQRKFIDSGTDQWRRACDVLEKQVDDALAEAGFVHKFYRLPSTGGNSIAVCEIVKCKLGDQWQLNVVRRNGQTGRHGNTQDFPLRNSYLEVKHDIEKYLAKLERLQQRKQAKARQRKSKSPKLAALTSAQDIFVSD